MSDPRRNSEWKSSAEFDEIDEFDRICRKPVWWITSQEWRFLMSQRQLWVAHAVATTMFVFVYAGAVLIAHRFYPTLSGFLVIGVFALVIISVGRLLSYLVTNWRALIRRPERFASLTNPPPFAAGEISKGDTKVTEGVAIGRPPRPDPSAAEVQGWLASSGLSDPLPEALPRLGEILNPFQSTMRSNPILRRSLLKEITRREPAFFQPRLSPDLLALWMRDLASHPVDPEVANDLVDHPNPALMLQLDEEGIPASWPTRHPETLTELSHESRRDWFLDWFAGEVTHEPEILGNIGAKWRRRMLAESLLLATLATDISELPGPEIEIADQLGDPARHAYHPVQYEQLPLADPIAFWARFPQTEPALRHYVRSPGVIVTVKGAPSGRTSVQTESEPDPATTADSLLPQPPDGYYWADISGGTLMSDTRTFRLWHRDLGYAPRSE